ncbi:ATP-dependent helicase [Bradyrhizobium barranii subsp. apii]|uniref:ATP-dependent helicase n=1 Tax=Bradyrhizobium barranii subsp. apii TaxID=2819348 RepID=A0A8U0FX50_9BRAD|nr:ATP-dependent helicase [Bradyrhizobium barranii subsp. apii]
MNRPIEILRNHPEIRDEVRGQYLHILVDEYQDVNRASALLLKELAGEGKTLWVVGDARQSIYRFRGAAPTNTTNFEKDYPNAKRKALAINYRSRKQIVSRSRQDNGFVHFHRTVYRVLRWLSQQTGAVDSAQIKAEFDARWAETGPVGNPLELVYRTSAEQMLERERHRPRAGMRIAETVSVNIGGHSVRLEIDEIEQTGRNLIVRRLRTGRAPSTPDQRLLHALMLEASEQTLGGKGSFRIRYLSTDDEMPVKLDGVMPDRLERASAAMLGLGQGAYPAKPSDDCPRCPHYFICSAVPD